MAVDKAVAAAPAAVVADVVVDAAGPGVARPGDGGDTPLKEATAALEYGDEEGDLFVFDVLAMAAVVDDEAVDVEFSDEVVEDIDEFDEDEDDDDDDEEEDESAVVHTKGVKPLLFDLTTAGGCVEGVFVLEADADVVDVVVVVDNVIELGIL